MVKGQRKQAPTMDDVARLAGVNRVTVSVALRGAQANTRISAATRQRILDAAQQLGYTPSAIAMALRNQRTDIIGYYSGHGPPNAIYPFSAAVINGLQEGCSRYNKDLLMYIGKDRDTLEQTYAALVSQKIDGLIFLPSPNNQLIERLTASHLPVVAIANAIVGLPSVVVDDLAGGALIANHLAARGHRHIMYRCDLNHLVSSERRQQAFLTTAAAAGMQVTITRAATSEGRLSEQELALLAAPKATRPTVAVCWADTFAYTLLNECHERGIRVPDDLAVTGFDGVPMIVRPNARMTTVSAPWTAVAAKAVDVLLAVINGEPAPPETIFPVSLVVGDTA